MRALLEVAFESQWIVAWIEWACPGCHCRDPNPSQVIRGVNRTGLSHFFSPFEPVQMRAMGLPFTENSENSSDYSYLRLEICDGRSAVGNSIQAEYPMECISGTGGEQFPYSLAEFEQTTPPSRVLTLSDSLGHPS